MTDTPFRVQPVLDDDNRFFWTSGQDGLLRFARCGDCGYWLHPPTPRCPMCTSTDVVHEPVSGRGVVWSFTINHHSWDGSTEPWAIVLVELAEQEGLRLTSNLVNCPTDDVRIGMEVQVTFEENNDLWYPLFEPVEAP
ncbi:MAG: Zn-ribbon domain-containing OB-fold protein [Microthrixaceae bacterium]